MNLLSSQLLNSSSCLCRKREESPREAWGAPAFKRGQRRRIHKTLGISSQRGGPAGEKRHEAKAGEKHSEAVPNPVKCQGEARSIKGGKNVRHNSSLATSAGEDWVKRQGAESSGWRSRRKESTEDSYSALTRRGDAGLERADWGSYF